MINNIRERVISSYLLVSEQYEDSNQCQQFSKFPPSGYCLVSMLLNLNGRPGNLTIEILCIVFQDKNVALLFMQHPSLAFFYDEETFDDLYG